MAQSDSIGTTEQLWQHRFSREMADVQAIPLNTAALYRTLEGTSSLGYPGFPPYTRGIKASMYLGKRWTCRQYAGFSTAEESNAFYRAALAEGQQGLSVAFDLATHRGYDSDHPRVRGDVGRAGVAIDTAADMERLFQHIPLQQVSVSMTMNGAVLPVMAAYLVAAERQGIAWDQLSGTLQNDILKEFMVRNTYIYPPEASMRIVCDIIAFCSEHMPRFHPISISGYHLQEAGADLAQELAYTLANALSYVRAAVQHGLDIDQFAPRLSFFFGVGMDFFGEIAKLRAARLLWYQLTEPFAAQNPKSRQLRMHCQTSGYSLSAQEPYNNLIRTTLEALAAVLGGTQSLHTNAYDEALGLPTTESARLARNTQLILAHETGIADVIDPLGGSFYLEQRTQAIAQAARELIAETEAAGGMLAAIAQGIPQQHIAASATHKQARLEQGLDAIVGVNIYRLNQATGVLSRPIDSQAVRLSQIERLNQTKQQRDPYRWQEAMQALREAAQSQPSTSQNTSQNNLLMAAVACMRAQATVGEVSQVLEEVYGRYQSQMQHIAGIFEHYHSPTLDQLKAECAGISQKIGHIPSILMAKLGQDGHSRGLQVMSGLLTDVGFRVLITPLFQTPQEVAQEAQDVGVDIIGISSLAGAHNTLVPELLEILRQNQVTPIGVVLGGVIPPEDQPFLWQAGITDIFASGTPAFEAVERILQHLELQHLHQSHRPTQAPLAHPEVYPAK